MSQYAKIKAQIAELQAQADEVRHQEVAAVIAELQGKIAEYGLTAQDLGFAERARRGRPPKKGPLPPKYRDPKSGSTWSGRGKPPHWIVGKKPRAVFDRLIIERLAKRKPHLPMRLSSLRSVMGASFLQWRRLKG